ncbi:serine protease [Streptomyces sp. N2-109]|uniref:Serine protease n=1 Tax=Streptomyces gossypii TaxID=2883101 RepID=A0ABT2JVE8_9ACTN|nr:serine protease [Streptomyces gossypii]MCT2591811.1 serine protease [Streptomyces gossypii]
MSAVESFVRAAVVRIGAPGDGYDRRSPAFWGSGFFVAPGWVLTCAHVVGSGGGAVWRGERVIGVTTGAGQEFAGELVCGLPPPADPERPPSPWGDPDLALVRVPEATDPSCLWLSDRSALAPAEVGLYGYMAGPGGGQVFAGGAGLASGGSGGPLMLSGSYLPSGCSGGPVVDQQRGSVIGVNKGRARGEANSALATPITALRTFCDAGPAALGAWQEALRAHDEHHLARYLGSGPSWPRLQVELAPGGQGFTADHRAELYGRFAELPPPASAGQVLALVDEARRGVLMEPYAVEVHAPSSWREGAGLIYDPHDGLPSGPGSTRDLEREAVVLYAAHVCAALSRAAATPDGPRATGPDALGALRTWVETMSRSLRNGLIRQRVPRILDSGRPAADPRADPSADPRAGAHTGAYAYADVLVEIDPDLYGTHAWRIKLVREDGEVTPVRHSELGVPRTELEGDIRSALATALDRGDIGEHLAAVDFSLPRALFDEPVETWRAREPRADEPFSPHTLPLGRRRPVALRDAQRRLQQVTPEWRRRWTGIARGALDAVPLCLEVPEHGHDAALPEDGDAAYGRLLDAPLHAVPVHCSRGGSGRGAAALGVALAAGHPVALWRRCDERHTDCAEFYDRAAVLLRSLRHGNGNPRLPELVRSLRNQTVGQGTGPEVAWARQLVLLYDPPHGQQPAETTLHAPPLRR